MVVILYRIKPDGQQECDKSDTLGIYHVIKEKYLQYYLNEFCYKLNRRYSTNLFDNLIFSSV